ncbi:cytochrome c [Colwellia demingiae]|uniref:Cytochrome c n=1 Tax=Colwellia demingiae TaxID=89401 RepID=A0A5C6QIG7_9GAMM|nr:cytochrome c [Colwellia demingiae]TWX68754.1 cytochrome c [Colwellia demingiae]
MSPIKITLSGLAIATHLLSLIFVTAAVAANDDTNKEALSQARKDQLTHIVKQDCGSCHGMTLKGGLGPALLPENLEGKSIPYLQYTILHGRTGTAMPPWKPLLTEQEALWISQQLKAGKVAKQ